MTDLRPVRLRCEQREDVPCIDTPAPRLGWALASGEQGRRQTAYRIRVVGEHSTLWDTGKVASERSVDIAYAGRELPPASEFSWTVEVWDEAGSPSGARAPARFRTGPSAWRGQWIGRDRTHDPGMAAPASDDPPDKLLRRLLSCPYLRRPFALTGSAMAGSCARSRPIHCARHGLGPVRKRAGSLGPEDVPSSSQTSTVQLSSAAAGRELPA